MIKPPDIIIPINHKQSASARIGAVLLVITAEIQYSGSLRYSDHKGSRLLCANRHSWKHYTVLAFVASFTKSISEIKFSYVIEWFAMDMLERNCSTTNLGICLQEWRTHEWTRSTCPISGSTCQLRASRRMPSSGMWLLVPLVRSDVLEECIGSIIRATRIGELGTTLTVINK
jgi:hypothetical protein